MTNTIGIDVGGTSLRAAVVDDQGHILDRERVPTPRSVNSLDNALVSVVQRLQSRHSIAAVGLAVAGFLDANCATVRFAPHLPWRSALVRDTMQERLQLPVVLEHDCNSAAWAESVYGAAVGASMPLMIALGTGIGAAFISDGKLFRGAYGTAPELGHLQVVPNGRACSCGKQGCLERYCSGTALVDSALEHMVEMPDTPTSLGKDVTPESELTGRRVMDAAREKDPIAMMAVDDMAYWLGIGMAMGADLFDPDLIVIAGGVSSAGGQFLSRAREVYASHITGAGYRPLATIKQAELGDNAGQVGAADLARRALTKEN